MTKRAKMTARMERRERLRNQPVVREPSFAERYQAMNFLEREAWCREARAEHEARRRELWEAHP